MFCVGITAFRPLESAMLQPSTLLGVYGLGGVGMFCIRFAKTLGLRIFGIDIAPAMTSLAEKYGADATVDSSDDTGVAKATPQRWGNTDLDAAIVAAGAPMAYVAAVRDTAFDGWAHSSRHSGCFTKQNFRRSIITVGVPHEPVQVNVLSSVRKNLRMQGTQAGSPLNLWQMMEAVEAISIIPDVQNMPFKSLPDFMDTMADGKATGKVGVVYLSWWIERHRLTAHCNSQCKYTPSYYNDIDFTLVHDLVEYSLRSLRAFTLICNRLTYVKGDPEFQHEQRPN